jgi:hypothetical protein
MVRSARMAHRWPSHGADRAFLNQAAPTADATVGSRAVGLNGASDERVGLRVGGNRAPRAFGERLQRPLRPERRHLGVWANWRRWTCLKVQVIALKSLRRGEADVEYCGLTADYDPDGGLLAGATSPMGVRHKPRPMYCPNARRAHVPRQVLPTSSNSSSSQTDRHA